MNPIANVTSRLPPCLICGETFDDPTTEKTNVVLSHGLSSDDKVRIHPVHWQGCVNWIHHDERYRCTGCDQDISSRAIHIFTSDGKSPRLPKKVSFSDHKMDGDRTRAILHPSILGTALSQAVKRRQLRDVRTLLIESMARSNSQGDENYKEIKECFAYSVNLLKQDRFQFEVLEIFLQTFSPRTTMFYLSDLDKALSWSIETGNSKFFQAILTLRLEFDDVSLNTEKLLSIIKEINKSSSPEKLKKILFEKDIIDTELRGATLRVAIDDGALDTAIRLLQGTIYLKHKVDAIESALDQAFAVSEKKRDKYIGIVKQIFDSAAMEDQKIKEFQGISKTENIGLAVQNLPPCVVLTGALCRVLGNSDSDPKKRETVLGLLQEIPLISREHALYELAAHGQFLVIKDLFTNGWSLEQRTPTSDNRPLRAPLLLPLFKALDEGELDRVTTLLMESMSRAEGREEGNYREIKTFFSYSRKLLKCDPSQEKLLEIFLELFPTDTTVFDLGDLHNALIWSIQESRVTLFQLLWRLRKNYSLYPPLITQRLPALIKEIDQSKRAEEFRKIVFETEIIKPKLSDKALQAAILARDTHKVTRLLARPIDLKDRCESIDIAISMGWTEIVKEIFHGAALEEPVIWSTTDDPWTWRTTDDPEKRERSIHDELVEPRAILTWHLCSLLNHPKDPNPEPRGTVVTLLQEIPEISREDAVLALVDHRQFLVLNYLFENGWRLNTPSREQAISVALEFGDEEIASLLIKAPGITKGEEPQKRAKLHSKTFTNKTTPTLRKK
jgi:hypothetical protein